MEVVMFDYGRQQDAMLVPWLAEKFKINVQWNDYAIPGARWIAIRGEWDLDIRYAVDDSVFGVALEYCACYDGDMFDKLVEIELGEFFERVQLPNKYMGLTHVK
jgi:hypothetical protein